MAAIKFYGSSVVLDGSVDVEEHQPPEGLSMPGEFIAVPFADQLAPPPPIPDAGAFVWQRHIVDSAGNILTDARVEVRHAETNGIADIYTDRAATIRKSNPFLVDSEGFARFYATAGLYTITASRAGLERIFENVLLGVRLEDMPDLTTVVQPLVDAALADDLDELDAELEALPDLVGFKVLDSGTASGMPGGWTSTRMSPGYYRITHNLGHTGYHVKLTVWDPSGDRVYSAMMYDKQLNYFEYRVRSIFDEASNSDAAVNVEVTI